VLSQQELSDRAQITDVLHVYAAAVVQRDVDLLVSLFTDDATLDYQGHPDVRGADQVRAMFSGQLSTIGPNHRSLPFDEYIVSAPLLTNILIDLDGDEADATSYCLATHAGTIAGDGRVIVRATRNLDRFRRVEGRWRIGRRIHDTCWGIEHPATVVKPADGTPERALKSPPMRGAT